jgi:hypothetical protein
VFRSEHPDSFSSHILLFDQFKQVSLTIHFIARFIDEFLLFFELSRTATATTFTEQIPKSETFLRNYWLTIIEG